TWQLVDAVDKVLWTVNFGHGPLRAFDDLQNQTLVDEAQSATHWSLLAFKFLGEGRIYEALVVAARAAGQGDKRTLTQLISMHVLPTQKDAAVEMAVELVRAM